MRKSNVVAAAALSCVLATAAVALPARADEGAAASQDQEKSQVVEVVDKADDDAASDTTDDVKPAESDAAEKDAEQATDGTEKDAADAKADATDESKDAAADAADPATPADPAADEATAQADAKATAKLTAQAHVANIGWMDATTKAEGNTMRIGTTGRGLQMEALKLALSGVDGAVEIQAHVANEGWVAWSAGQAGTTGRGWALEALRVRLTGAAAENYDIYYRVHAANVGWMGWTKNGEAAGTQGFGNAVEAVEFLVVAKGEKGPSTSTAFKAKSPVSVNVVAGVLGRGWQGGVTGGKTAGTTGQGRALTGVAMSIDSANWVTGSVQYRVSTSFTSMGSWTSAGVKTGSNTGSAPVQTMQVQLTGDMAEAYDVYYRVHAANVGWMGWAKNGETAGSENPAQAAEAVQVVLVEKGGKAPGSTSGAYASYSPAGELRGQAHVSNEGWMSVASGSQITLGTTGKSLQLEALALDVFGTDGTVSIETHVSNVGWMRAASAGSVAGTTGCGNAIEALKMSLNGAAAEKYDLYYQAHVAGIGWLGWAKAGSTAGTVGYGRAIEAVTVRLVAKGSAAPSASGPAALTGASVTYNAHIQNIGWQGNRSNGAFSGTSGQSKRIEAFKLSLSSDVSGSINYQAHVQDYGWMSAAKDGAVAGTTGQGKRVEAVKIWLSGDISNYYDVYYRVYIEDYGWMGWAKNGAAAGSSSVGLRVEGLEVRLVLKGNAAPGVTANAFTNKPKVPPMSSDQVRMYYMAQNYSSQTDWLIMVDTSLNRIGVFRGSKGNWTWDKFWMCSTGKPLTPTVLGEYRVYGKGYSFGSGFTCYYYTQFYGDYLIHSVLYYQDTFNEMDGRLGENLSHGCVRLSLENAKWIYDNVPYNTKVVTYD